MRIRRRREDVVQAAILASAHEFIANMPDGYDTVIGASGKDLSGGENRGFRLPEQF